MTKSLSKKTVKLKMCSECKGVRSEKLFASRQSRCKICRAKRDRQRRRIAVVRKAPAFNVGLKRNIAGDVKIHVVVSDIHVPFQDKNCAEAVCAVLDDLKPNGFKIAGDFLDLFEVSSHNKGSLAKLEGHRISNTWDGGNKLLDMYDTAAGPQCREKDIIEGNHEFRLLRWLEQGDNAVFIGDEGVSIPGRLNLEKRGYTYHKNYPEAHIKVGKLLITHGRWCSKYHAATHLDRFRVSVMYGHTHTPQMFMGSGFEKQQAGFGLGHLASRNSVAVKYAPQPNGWHQGFGVVYERPDGNFSAQLLNFQNGILFFGNRQYGRLQKNAA